MIEQDNSLLASAWQAVLQDGIGESHEPRGYAKQLGYERVAVRWFKPDSVLEVWFYKPNDPDK